MIKLQGLHKFFNKGKPNEIHVINDVNLELPDKGMVAIWGKSGCGKTTLLNVIGGLDAYESGTLTLDGKSIDENTDVMRNRYIGYIFQNYNLNGTESCFDNVADALRLCGMTDAKEIERRVTAALRNVGMEKYAHRPPDTLSGGQQQRIAIARAIVKNPRVILADEPTGNLDEANTVMIMDLLKAIAKDHLVLLVTHEADLVVHYCELAIQLRDGQVVNIKHNDGAEGFAARDKNDIYLGELGKAEFKSALVGIEYYGEAPKEPLQLKVVNNGGKLYVQIDTPKVQILDAYSEVKLREGVFEAKPMQNTVSQSIDMSDLPPVEGTRHGHLFSFGSSVKSGYAANFKHRKKGKKVLSGCMCLFAAALVLMSAVFGTALGDVIHARNSYNHNVFYVYTPNGEISEKLVNAVNADGTGIDYVRMHYSYPFTESTVYFNMGYFETFSADAYRSSFTTNAAYLELSMAEELPLVEGKKEALSDEELLITTAVADALLENSSLGHISEYDDLLGLVSQMFSINGKSPRIAGIVKSDESAIYLTELAMARYVNGSAPAQICLAADYGMTVEAGEAVLVFTDRAEVDTFPEVGETIRINGIDIKVVDVLREYAGYHEWVKDNVEPKLSEIEFFTELAAKENPALVGDAALRDVAQALAIERYYEYSDYYYAQMKDYVRDRILMDPGNIYAWLALEKGIEEAFYVAAGAYEYALARQYKTLNGYYPTQAMLKAAHENFYLDAQELLAADVDSYAEEFQAQSRSSSRFTRPRAYYLSESDYITMSHRIGESHDSVFGEYAKHATVAPALGSVDESVMDSAHLFTYTLIHSDDPKATAAWLARELPELDTGTERLAILTPDDMFDSLIRNQMAEILTSLVTVVVILAIMCLCMYFIMRSSLMNRIKEIGIYRAIGVSKRNLIFKFFVEALVLSTLTVFIGYLIASGFLFVCLGISPLVEMIFFYPWWMAVGVLLVLYGLCLFCGVFPILLLLRKTPSEILAKYDI